MEMQPRDHTGNGHAGHVESNKHLQNHKYQYFKIFLFWLIKLIIYECWKLKRSSFVLFFLNLLLFVSVTALSKAFQAQCSPLAVSKSQH